MAEFAEARLRSDEQRPRAGGFTLIELMVVIAIAAILVMIAIPSFVDMIQRNRVSGEVNSFVGDLQFARAEAIKSGQTVSICPSSDHATCLGANTWHSGWIVFSDVDANGVVNTAAGDVVMRYRSALTSGDTFTVVTTPALSVITYGRNGFASNLGGATAQLKLVTSPSNAKATKCVTLNLVGRQVAASC